REALYRSRHGIPGLTRAVFAEAFRGDLTADWREKNPDVEHALVFLDRIREERQQKREKSELAKMQAIDKLTTDPRWREQGVSAEHIDEGRLPVLPEGWSWTTVGALVERIEAGNSFA